MQPAMFNQGKTEIAHERLLSFARGGGGVVCVCYFVCGYGYGGGSDCLMAINLLCSFLHLKV